jgi:hypothetical protein
MLDLACPFDEYDPVDEASGLLQLSSNGAQLCAEVAGLGAEGVFPPGVTAEDLPGGCVPDRLLDIEQLARQ